MITLSLDAPAIEVQATALLRLLPVFLEDCARRGVATTTLTDYADTLRPFERWWIDVGARTGYILTPNLLRAYGAHLEASTNRSGNPLRRGTIETYTRRTRLFLRWLYTSGRLPVDMSQWIPKPTAPKPRKRLLTIEQIGALMTATGGGYRLRNMALIAFLVDTGVRRHEAAAATWGNVQWAGKWHGCVHLEVAKRYLDTDKRRDVVFGEKTGKLLQLHRILQAPSEDDRIFRISNAGIAKMLSKVSEKTGIDFGAHDMRRTWATYWIKHCHAPNRDYAERLLEVQLGHSPRTVAQRHYMALTHEDVLANWVSPMDVVTVPGLTI